MKIVITTLTYPEGSRIGGAEEQCCLLAEYLLSKGHEVSFMALKGQEKGREEKKDGLSVYTLGSFTSNFFFSIFRCAAYLRRKKPDVWYVRYFRDIFFMMILGKFLGIPVVLNTTHIDNCFPVKDVYREKGFWARLKAAVINIKQFLNFQSLRFLDIITINKTHVEILKKSNIKSLCIYNSVKDHYLAGAIAKQKKVVWVANLKQRKRPEVFLKLAERFRESDYEFVMIGNIHDRSYGQMISNAQKICPNLKYLGGKSFKETDEILAGAMVLVHTCEPEGFGNNFIHAWLAECPTIALEFDPDGIIEREGIGFKSGTIEQMEKDLRFLMENPDILAAMGKKARQWALSNHQMAVNGPKYENFFKNVHEKKNQ